MPGDGIGPEIMGITIPVLDAAVRVEYGTTRRIEWAEVDGGQTALEQTGDLLPDATIETIRKYGVAIKGPTMTPVGGGHRSINVRLRQVLDLYSNVRPVRYFPGIVSPMVAPERVNVTIFRENTEDVYAGIEFFANTESARILAKLLEDQGHLIPEGAGLGIKVISRAKTRRLVKRAVEYAHQHGLRTVTIVHKGNIMKATEGAFMQWGYELVREELSDIAVVEGDAGAGTDGRVMVNDRIADAMFQELILNPELYDVLATPNLNGDYISDAAAALVGGLGVAPGANIGDKMAVFEATHGTAPNIAGKNIANPGSLILSGAMMLDYLGMKGAGDRVRTAFAATIALGRMTSDLAVERGGIEVLGTTEFGMTVIDEIVG